MITDPSGWIGGREERRAAADGSLLCACFKSVLMQGKEKEGETKMGVLNE